MSNAETQYGFLQLKPYGYKICEVTDQNKDELISKVPSVQLQCPVYDAAAGEWIEYTMDTMQAINLLGQQVAQLMAAQKGGAN